jgi:hypothetical protein
MTNNKLNLPKDYVPFGELILCSNSFINGFVPIEISGHIPFLIGNGEYPTIWISKPASKDGSIWKDVVIQNKTPDNNISIIFSEKEKLVNISIGSIILIQAKKISNDKAEVMNIDLRPLGLNIYGDIHGLYVATNLFSNNSFSNVYTMMALG